MPGVAAGSTLGEFRLLRALGQGGMGQVWEAEQTSLRRTVALKLVRPDRVNARTLELFAREARAGGRLSHPGLVDVYAFGEDEGLAWIAMELVPGAWTLRDFIDTAARDEGSVSEPYRDVAYFIARAADAMVAAHAAGVVHRDLKPSNILVTPEDEPKITDFGLARIVDESALSETGDFLGTYQYASPEQIAASRTGLDHRTDIFSLGVVLYEMLALRRPFEGDSTQQIARKIAFEDPPDLRSIRSKIPRDLAVITARCLEKDMTRRYASMADLTADLRRHLEHRPIEARPPSQLRKLQLWARRRPALAAAGGVFAIAFAVISFLLADNLRTNRALEARSDELAAEVASVKRLSALQDLDVLVSAVDDAWPAVPETIPTYRAWIDEARRLVDDVHLHQATRDGLRAQASAVVDPESGETTWQFADSDEGREARWWHASLVELIDELEALVDEESGLLSEESEAVSTAYGWSIPRRLAFARRLESGLAPGGEWSERWIEAAGAIGADPTYSGLKLEEQLGLVPIGQDPESGLWEFWHVASGAEPVRADDGTLVPEEDWGIVLVLIPGDSFWMGATKDPAAPHNVDPEAEIWEGPVHEVTLTPYFISKYELTQGQWLRFTGANPSYYDLRTNLDGKRNDLTHPVEEITWLDAQRELRRMGLALPTDAQWENACRAGSMTRWWSGDAPEDLDGVANLADRSARRSGAPPSWPFQEWLDDEYGAHAPAGTYAPNAFGLHEVHGNVWEWCADAFDRDAYDTHAAVDPYVPPKGNDNRIYRGGSFSLTPVDARSALRFGASPTFADYSLGVRPARAIVR
ncbi:MAG: bifunctional serine/threonine-protein kinase/formylglycine-generating enzyme family protein [Planctomycetota bacterium]